MNLSLAARIDAARQALTNCHLCEWHCGIDRTRGEPAPCKLGSETRCFRSYVSMTEELELVPTRRVYLAGCNFRCRFCDTGPTCFDPRAGRPIEAEPFAADLSRSVRDGVRSIHLLGGEPSLHPHTILELAAAAESPLPIVLDTNLYMTPQVLDWLDGVVTWIVGDFKFGNDACARRLAGVERYVDVVTRNLMRIAERGTNLLVRHLLMPGHLECCFKPVAEWIAKSLPNVRFELATGYVPCWRAERDPDLGRLNAADEVAAARRHLRSLRLPTEAAIHE